MDLALGKVNKLKDFLKTVWNYLSKIIIIYNK